MTICGVLLRKYRAWLVNDAHDHLPVEHDVDHDAAKRVGYLLRTGGRVEAGRDVRAFC